MRRLSFEDCYDRRVIARIALHPAVWLASTIGLGACELPPLGASSPREPAGDTDVDADADADADADSDTVQDTAWACGDAERTCDGAEGVLQVVNETGESFNEYLYFSTLDDGTECGVLGAGAEATLSRGDWSVFVSTREGLCTETAPACVLAGETTVVTITGLDGTVSEENAYRCE